ncbi:MAG: HzsA-related protein [Candidatus Zipacnadales bacterium]
MNRCFRMAALALFLSPLAMSIRAPQGTESIGNVDGVLTWSLGSLAPGETTSETVLFTFASSYDELTARLPSVRQQFISFPNVGSITPSAGRIWITGKTTDFALDPAGTFYWEGDRQALGCTYGGQLSRLGYYVHYNTQRAGTAIQNPMEVENLRVTHPIAPVGGNAVQGLVETADGWLRIRIRAMVSDGPDVALQFVFTNTAEASVADLRLTVYANPEAAHTYEGDYCLLDRRTAGLLAVDPETKLCLLMAGLREPASGFAGNWPSEAVLREAMGVPFGEWPAFEGLPPQLDEQLRRSVPLPHEIARPLGVEEPATRTLSPEEADAILVRDWLFQADGHPTYWHVQKEISWARELAARIAKHSQAPDLSAELQELERLEARCREAIRPQVERAALPAGLIAHYPFDDLEGRTIADASGNGHTGFLIGSAGLEPGLFGTALNLNGGYVNIGAGPASLVTGDYTLSAWLKTTSEEADILGTGVGERHVLFMTYRGVLRGHHWTLQSGNVLDGKRIVNDARWHHVVQVVTGDRIALYVDGTLDASQPFIGVRLPLDAPFLIASRSESAPRPLFTGSLDDVCLFARALTHAEIEALYEEGKDVCSNSDPEAAEVYLAVRRVKRRIMFSNPVLNFDELLFIDQPYPQGAEWPHEARHRNGMMAMPGGRLLVLKGLHPGGELRKLAPLGDDSPASFWRPDLSFDARRVLFCMKPAGAKSFHLYEIGLDGKGLRQLTNSDYDDLDPIYLPDGHLMFSTTRCNTYIRCMPYTYAYVLARCKANGSEIYIISQGNEPDWLPTLLHDGRVIYTRWEYTDKALWRIQSLWTTNPDGTGTATFWGNQSVWPDMLIEPRPIPGSSRVMFTGAAHHDWFAGSVGIIDPSKGFNFPDGLTKVTADVPWPECGPPPLDPLEADDYHRSGPLTAYKSPYPLSEEDFLVSARAGSVPTNGDGTFRLYLMDVHGNRELIYEGTHNILYAIPIRARSRPPVRPDQVRWPGTGANHRPTAPGLFYSSDVYEGVPDLPRSMAKYLRVIQMDSRTYSTWVRDAMPHQHQGPTVSLLQSDGVKRVLGTVPVAEDGSVMFEAPPGVALHFQLLDEKYRALQTMRSFTGLMPGEQRGCVGCHESHSVSPVNRKGTALQQPPAQLTPPPWGAETSLGYERLIHPLLQRYCGQCHMGDGSAREKFDLTLRPGQGIFKEPYVTLVGGSVYHAERTLKPPESLAACPPVESYPIAGVPEAVQTFRPLQYLSYASKLVNHYAASGEHYGVKMSGDDLQLLIAWVDAICPYRGEEEIRAIPDPDFPGIELLPIRPRTATAPHIDRFNLPQDTLVELAHSTNRPR